MVRKINYFILLFLFYFMSIFLNTKSKTNDPPNTPDLSPIENLCGTFKARVEMSKPYSRNLEYLQVTWKPAGK
jgi:hypothetical protein